jgi:hypothetical protein
MTSRFDDRDERVTAPMGWGRHLPFRTLALALLLFFAIALITAHTAGATDYGLGDCAAANDPQTCEYVGAMYAQGQQDSAAFASMDGSLQCLLLAAEGNRATGGNLSGVNGCVPLNVGGSGPTYAELTQGVDLRGPIAVKNESGGKLAVHCDTGAGNTDCAGSGGSGGGGTSCTVADPCPVVIDSAGNVIQLDAEGTKRADLAWWGAWACCGVLLALLVVPRILQRFQLWRGD